MQDNALDKFLDFSVSSESTEAPSECLFNLQNALEMTIYNARTYLQTHTFDMAEQGDESMAATVKFAVARLEWLLDEARQEISGLFTKEEFNMLLNCFQGEFLTPDDCQRMASSLCDELGIELDRYRESGLAELIDKLLALTVPQRAALADALEVAWHSGRPFDDAMTDMGIELR